MADGHDHSSGQPADRAGRAARRYYVATLGCKLNRYDSAHAEGILRRGRYLPTDEPREADVIVLNTCTVTARADADGRKLARRLRRANPSARIVATGCYAERDPRALAALGVLDDIVGLSERERLVEALLGVKECVTAPLWLQFGDRARAFLRVQEGCDLSCSYCVIPSVRGPGRSVPAGHVLEQLAQLAASGVREVGLTGVNTGGWGRDLAPRQRLADLLEAIDRAGLPLRIRLNSLEPRTVARRIVERIAAAPERLLPHIQIPLQSGCDRILARMRRNYRARDYAAIVESVARAIPDICLGADVITGFPGESDADFAETERFLAGLPLAYLHVFSYSPRPGTRAAALGDRLPPPVIRSRTAALRARGQALARAFRQRLVGRTFDGLVLDSPAPDGASRVLTGNYVEARVPGAPAGEIVRISIDALANDGTTVRGSLAS